MDWLFQCNRRRYDLAAFFEGGGTSEDWAMNQGRNLVSPGDRVFFWQTGVNGQLLTIGRSCRLCMNVRLLALADTV
jgi:hypothetical protein